MRERSDLLVPVGHKFACVAFEAARSGDTPALQDLGDGLSIRFGELPFDCSNWRSFLGESFLEDLEECNAFVLAVAPSERPEVMDDENEQLARKTEDYVFALLVRGCSVGDKPITLSGANEDGRAQPRNVSTWWGFSFDPSNVSLNSALFEIDNSRLKAALKVFRGIQRIGETTGLRHEFWRITLGYKAFVAGHCEKVLEVRLHQFVRALEALDPPSFQGRRAFAEHMSGLLVATKDQEALVKLYRLRSEAEHLKDCQEILKEWGSKDPVQELRRQSFMAERLCSELYSRLFSDLTLLEQFRTDNSIEAFWKDKAERINDRAFGEPVDLDELVKGVDFG